MKLEDQFFVMSNKNSSLFVIHKKIKKMDAKSLDMQWTLEQKYK